MPDLLGNGNSKQLYRSLPPLPRGFGGRLQCLRGRRTRYWPSVLVFLLVTLESIARGSVLANTCSYLGYYLDNVSVSSTLYPCLSLTTDLNRQICDKQVKARTKMIRRRNIRLKLCSSYPIYSLISASNRENPCKIAGSMPDCTNCLDRLLAIDQEVEQSITGFQDILERMDCTDRYSVKWNCTHCKTAYKEWLCATKLTYYHNNMDQPVPPCGDFCSKVEKMCPFFRPDNDDTHAGDPSFICKDPEIASQSSLYGNPPGCYKLCHLLADYNDVHCHKINLASNKNLTVVNATVATSSATATAQHRCYSVVTVIQFILFMLTVRTVLQYTSLGLT
ncbi:NALCN channel auxiliary factor 1-like [Haliotis cracherodii]|uniref:NALCN channel auxiliary factor 1-like n=1 Tax=Haliotis cracherodii TaxID=6455 RepID=UPI0039ECC509